MRSLVLGLLSLILLAATARAEEKPVSPALAEDFSGKYGVALPSAWSGVALTHSGAPNIVLAGERVVVDHSPAGDTQALREKNHPWRVSALFRTLEQRRERWKRAYPEAEFPGQAVLWLDRSTPALVVKSLFQTAAFAGYPKLAFAVRSPSGALSVVLASARLPLPPRHRRSPSALDPFALHVEHRSDGNLHLIWKDGIAVLKERELSEVRSARGFPELAKVLVDEWQAHGGHRTRHDVAFDQAVLHVDNGSTFEATVALIDAMHAPQREYQEGGQVRRVSAFQVTFAVN